ncbi:MULTISPECIES: hypothetical protein [unclassified Treponema]|uniref:hypothetical protein n=1 Tax=unclassified Treponema TaxID=2638727 RepID=UPI0020A2E902|nr:MULTISPECIES: hypothetical protein [unclassified Treponema]UTC68198.1 hypothetical protein E4O06_06070 [Treponema sp. OMZ 789]UTC70918.1 hypothetical protein E4O01_06215 [Treponema sp. OMZ 790]UTC73658.1 hypothetical protein E4O02_06410 [Treponema sp. OMZ 791]
MNTVLPFSILTSTGFGGTGSSAGTNILEEFSSVTSFGNDFECTFLHEADGLFDLEKAFVEGHRLKVDLAVKRFLLLAEKLQHDYYYKKHFGNFFYSCTERFIESIVDCKWNGWWHRSLETKKISAKEHWRCFFAKLFFEKLYEKKHLNSYEPDGWQPCYHTLAPCCYAYKKDDFYENAKQYIANVFSNLSVSTKYAVFDQLLPAYSIDNYRKYFNSIKTLVIDKDPRDLYAVNKSEWGVGYIPSDINTFITWYRSTRFERHKINTEWKDTALFLPFESLIYDYEASLEKIKAFTGLTTEEHRQKKQYFDPVKSIVNTQVYKRYPALKEDIKKIENELKEFCFPFEKYPGYTVPVFPDTHIFIRSIQENAEYVQRQGKLPPAYRGKTLSVLARGTHFVSTIKSFKVRKTKKLKLKGIVKACIYLLLFPFEFVFFTVCFMYCRRSNA